LCVAENKGLRGASEEDNACYLYIEEFKDLG